MKNTVQGLLIRLIIGFVACVFSPMNRAAQDQADLRLSTAGLGSAILGMSAKQVESAIGHRLVTGNILRQKWLKAECTVAAHGLPGTYFVFDRDMLIAVILRENSNLMTRSGIRIGDTEGKVINLLKSDKSFERVENHYGDGSMTSMEITVGTMSVHPVKQTIDGTMMKISSKKGRVVGIEAGLARYVIMVEHEGDECE